MTTCNRSNTLTSDRLLLVEGSDEVNITSKMLSKWNIVGIQVIDIGGKDSFKPSLEALLSQAKSKDIELCAVGIMRDADNSPQSAFQSVRNSLGSVSLPTPDSHGVFLQGAPSVGIFILPNGDSTGSVENLCWAAVEDTTVARCATAYLQCLQDSEALLSRNNSKTLIHAYLSAQDDPCARAGEGALKGYWPFDHPAFDPLKEFVSTLAIIN